MTRSRLFCIKNTKNMFVKIVHPGGHVELHDRPILASEIVLRNPRYIVAYSHVFQQPWAIVAPNTMLMLGQKFYAVPASTILKFQRKSSRSSSSSAKDIQTEKTSKDSEKDDQDSSTSDCLWMNMNIKSPKSFFHHFDIKTDQKETLNSIIRSNAAPVDTCFMHLLTGRRNNKASSDGSEMKKDNEFTRDSVST